MTDFRALCAELLSAMDTLYKQSVTTSYSQTIEINGIRHAIPIGKDILAQDAVYADLLDRTRAALDQPEPQGASDEAIMRLACSLLGYEFTPSLISNPENGIGALEALPSELLAFARAVLARWGCTTRQED